MSYISLYRKYRSQSFGEVIGQSHVTTVLQNAIRGGRIAHAYLFCGPRGCGKTSTARLLARALVCEKSDGPTPEPCGGCSLCRRVRDGNAIDVIEMDAASETGIDDVREKIIENAKFAPAEARYKVYIIDEVHDLSAKAFDSLLKTIEEPPAHVVFILATTEAHKVPITVRSRCQRLDFRRGRLVDLTANLRRVLEAEEISYEEEGLLALSRAADGSFRDSLSLLEQVLAYTDGQVTAAAVYDAVGAIGQEMLDSIVQTIAANDLHDAFLKAGELVESGKDVKQILISLQSHLRDLIVASSTRSHHALADVSPERFSQLREQARGFTLPHLLAMIDVLAGAERDVRFTNQHRLLLERAFWSILPGSLPATNPAPAQPAAPAPQAAVAARPAPATRIAAEAPKSPTGPAEPPAPAKLPDTVDLEVIRRVWPRVVRRIKQASPAASAYFNEVDVAGLEGTAIILEFSNDFNRSFVEKPKRLEVVVRALREELGVEFKVRCKLADPRPDPPAESGPETLDLLDSLSDSPPREGAPPRANGTTSPAGEIDLLALVEAEFRDRLIDD